MLLRIITIRPSHARAYVSVHFLSRFLYSLFPPSYAINRPKGKRPLGRPRRRWGDDIKMDVREIGINGANWIHLAQDGVQWRASVNTLINLRVPLKKSRIFFDKLSDNQLLK
jgi:hypothetical protein